MSILKSTNSGKQKLAPKLKDYGDRCWVLHVPEKQFRYSDDRNYIMNVEFKDPCDISLLPEIKSVTFRVWDGWDECIMHITTLHELDLATEWMRRYTTSYETRRTTWEITKQIIEIVKKQNEHTKNNQ